MKPVAGLIHEKESSYNLVQVIEKGSTRYLLLNEGQGYHSAYTPGQISSGREIRIWDLFLAAPFFNNPPYSPDRIRSLAVVGLAGGTIPLQYTAIFGPIPIDGIEIDPAIVDAGRRFFGMTQPNLNVIVGDGRAELSRTGRKYSVVALDAYRVPYIPWHLTTIEFFQEVRDRLEPDGVVALNVVRTKSDRRLIGALSGTLRAVFPSVHVVDVPGRFNSLIVATALPTVRENVAANLRSLSKEIHPLLYKALSTAERNAVPPPESEVVFTDDWAPVERFTDQMILNHLAGKGSESR